MPVINTSTIGSVSRAQSQPQPQIQQPTETDSTLQVLAQLERAYLQNIGRALQSKKAIDALRARLDLPPSYVTNVVLPLRNLSTLQRTGSDESTTVRLPLPLAELENGRGNSQIRPVKAEDEPRKPLTELNINMTTRIKGSGNIISSDFQHHLCAQLTKELHSLQSQAAAGAILKVSSDVSIEGDRNVIGSDSRSQPGAVENTHASTSVRPDNGSVIIGGQTMMFAPKSSKRKASAEHLLQRPTVKKERTN